ncbi:MAG: hypothetical protein RR803_02585 [Malacoplasma sp.]
MNYKRLVVTDDNRLDLRNFNLTPDNAEILDLNENLSNVCEDKNLQDFIKTTATDNKKIYFICLKENFGTHEQRIENIVNVNQYYKKIKKIFRSENIFFFIYNTYMKNEASINPSLKTPSTLSPQPSTTIDVNNNNNQADEVSTKSNSPFSFGKKNKKDNSQDASAENANAETEDTQSKGKKLFKKDSMSDEDLAKEIDNFSSSWNKKSKKSSLSTQAQSYSQLNDNIDEEPSLSSENPSDNYGDLFTFKPDEEKIQSSYDNYNDIDSALDSDESIDVPSQPLEDDIEEKESSGVVGNEWSELDTSTLYAETNENKQPVQNLYTNISDSSDMVDIPESFYDSDDLDIDLLNDDSGDYLDYKNDYELNVHALKSIYDFIWRMLILNNYNLKLNDLLYLTVNNLGAFSIGQSDFVRQISNKSDSLFDLILQLDIKLEFNNSLFYIYLAELFSIKANKIVINTDFLNTLAIWVNKNSKIKFIEQVEQFINYSTIYNKKIIFSHFVELSNFIKGCLLSIKPTMPILDVHRIIFNKFKKIRSENIFGFILDKVCQIFEKVGINIESEIFETPDKMFDGSSELLDDSSWKEKLIDLYKRLLTNVRNYILSKGNNELEIFNIYIDIKDLKMYFEENARDLLILKSDYHYSSPSNDKYLTIGDAFDRSSSNVPNASYKDSLAIDQENFFNKLEADDRVRSQNRPQNAYDLKKPEVIYSTENESEIENQTFIDDESDELNDIDETSTNASMNDFAYETDDSDKFYKDVVPTATLPDEAPSYEQNVLPQQEVINKAINSDNLSLETKFKFVNNGLEDMMSRKIDEYERKIKANIDRIETERQQLRMKMEELKNL